VALRLSGGTEAERNSVAFVSLFTLCHDTWQQGHRLHNLILQVYTGVAIKMTSRKCKEENVVSSTDIELRYTPKEEAPDVTVVVGGKEFEEFSRHLCCFSDYFHAALRSGMRETDAPTMRFEFPDKDPQEWELVRTMLRPFGCKLTQDNVTVLVPWFDELCCQEALQECDKLIESGIVPLLYHSLVTLPPLRKARYSRTKGVWLAVSKASTPFPDFFSNSLADPKVAFWKLLDILDVSLRYRLEGSKEGCFRVMESILTETITALKDLSGRAQVATLLADHEEFRKVTWDVLRDLIPSDVRGQLPCDDESILRSGAWSGIILSTLLAEALVDDVDDEDD
jgi:hypothetical protein